MMLGNRRIRASGQAVALSLLLAGCATSQGVRVESVSFAAGDAIAANTVMQMVDPWPRNVQHTDIAVPADRRQYRPVQGSEEGQADADTAAQADGGLTYQ